MATITQHRQAIRTPQGWAIATLFEAGAIRECEFHGWMQDRADPDARRRALALAYDEPPFGLSPEQAAAAIEDVLAGIGDSCPDCTHDRD